MKNIAIITARSGSKGLKDKNIKLLNGIPLIAYTIKAALDSKKFDEVMVSTDSEIYAEISKEYGANVPFLRSEITSGDTVGSWDVVKEVLEKYLEIGEMFDTVCLLQPTSPLRTSEHIKGGYELYQQKKANAITGVCKVEHSPIWTMLLPEDLSLKEYRRKAEVDLTRQEQGEYYQTNGALYIRKINYKKEEIVLEYDREYAYIMERKFSLDIDSQEDFEYVEFVIKKALSQQSYDI